MARLFKMLACFLAATVLVTVLGLFVFNLFDQSEHAIQVIPFSSDQ